MTTVVVLADPPIEGHVCQGLADSPLDAAERVELYEAMLADVCRAVDRSGGDVLVNYRPREHLGLDDSVSPKTEIERVVADAVEAPEAIRYEVQVGESYPARVGNTVTHLLNTEDEGSVHVVEPTVPLVTRQSIDSASMKLRRTPVAVAPAPGGRVGYAGFKQPVDFERAFEVPAVESLVEAAVAADLDVDFLPQLHPVESPADLASVVTDVRARERAGRKHPRATFDVIERYGLRAVAAEDGLALDRD